MRQLLLTATSLLICPFQLWAQELWAIYVKHHLSPDKPAFITLNSKLLCQMFSISSRYEKAAVNMPVSNKRSHDVPHQKSGFF